MNMDSRKSANISHISHIMKVPGGPPMHVHDVAGESAIYNPHHEGTYFITKRLHDKIVWFPQYHEYGMFNLECAEALTIHIHGLKWQI
jgi:hypothetical protein